MIISPEAEEDLSGARLWYDQRRDGLGTDFVQCVEETLRSVEALPQVHAPVYQDVRRALVRRFPYIVYYRIVDSEVVVIAVLHGRRHQRHWQSRI